MDINVIKQAGPLAAVEQTADSIVITGGSGKIQYVNPAFTAMTGYTSLEAIGQFTNILKSGRQSGEFYENLWNTIKSGRVWQGDIRRSIASSEAPESTGARMAPQITRRCASLR